MPDHFHGIIINTGKYADTGSGGMDHRVRPDNQDYWGEHIGSPQTGGTPLPLVVQWFKTMTTNEYIRGVKNLKCSTRTIIHKSGRKSGAVLYFIYIQHFNN